MISRVLLSVAALSTLACSPKCPTTSAPTTTSASRHSSDTIYRFDFVMTTADEGEPSSTTSFTLTLPEDEHGEVFVGKNTPLVAAAPTTSPANVTSVRQDIGTKVRARFETKGDAPLLYVDVASSSSQPPAVEKFTTQTRVLAPAGQPTVVAQLARNKHQVTFTVTPTKLR